MTQECEMGSESGVYNQMVFAIFSRLLREHKELVENTKGSSRELTKVCNVILDEFAKCIQGLQTDVRKYAENEQILQELGKKYLRSHKNMMNAIEAYKSSLTNVNLIYNTDEKLRRYHTCETSFKLVEADHTTLLDKVDALNKRKAGIISQCASLKE
jgi:hypothetical protein